MNAIEEIKLTGRLPSPPGVAMALLELTRGDDFSIEEIAKVIQADPALTGRILKLTNSSRNAGIRPITTVEEAVGRIGVSTLRSVALGFSLVSSYRSGTCQAFDFSEFWSQSLANALAAQAVSEELELASPGESYSCGLLSKIGQLGLACVHPEAYTSVLNSCGQENLLAAERAAFAVDHAELGSAMLLDWGLPKGLADVLGCFQDEGIPESLSRGAKNLIRIIRIAQPIAQACYGNEELTLEMKIRLELAMFESGMDIEEFQKLCDHVAESWQEWGGILQLETNKVAPFDLAAIEEEELTEEVLSQEGRREIVDGALRVLIVDEDLDSSKDLASALADSKHQVSNCSQGDKALATILESLPDIVICHAELTGQTGFDLVKTLRGCPGGREIYFVILGAAADASLEMAAFSHGADDFILQPCKPNLVRVHIDAAVRLVEMKRLIHDANDQLEKQVAEMAVLNRKLMKASLTDALTELPNRRSAMETLKEKWQEAQVEGSSEVAVLLFDIDLFKSVNDNFGHDVGDEVLKQTAQTLQGNMRTEDSIARIGGEEFLSVCGPSTASHAVELAEKLRVAVEENHIQFGDFDGNVTISIGVAFADARLEGYEAALKRADEALYAVKKSGRNQVHVVRQGAMV